MKEKPGSRRRRNQSESILLSPDLEHANAAVLNSNEAAGCGLLSADLAAGIGRVKRAKKLWAFASATGARHSKAMRFGKHPIVSDSKESETEPCQSRVG